MLSLVVTLFRSLIIQSLNLLFLFPSFLPLLAQIVGGLALFSVTLAALVPAYRISFQDPAVAMRE